MSTLVTLEDGRWCAIVGNIGKLDCLCRAFDKSLGFASDCRAWLVGMPGECFRQTIDAYLVQGQRQHYMFRARWEICRSLKSLV